MPAEHTSRLLPNRRTQESSVAETDQQQDFDFERSFGRWDEELNTIIESVTHLMAGAQNQAGGDSLLSQLVERSVEASRKQRDILLELNFQKEEIERNLGSVQLNLRTMVRGGLLEKLEKSAQPVVAKAEKIVGAIRRNIKEVAQSQGPEGVLELTVNTLEENAKQRAMIRDLQQRMSVVERQLRGAGASVGESSQAAQSASQQQEVGAQQDDEQEENAEKEKKLGVMGRFKKRMKEATRNGLLRLSEFGAVQEAKIPFSLEASLRNETNTKLWKKTVSSFLSALHERGEYTTVDLPKLNSIVETVLAGRFLNNEQDYLLFGSLMLYAADEEVIKTDTRVILKLVPKELKDKAVDEATRIQQKLLEQVAASAQAPETPVQPPAGGVPAAEPVVARLDGDVLVTPDASVAPAQTAPPQVNRPKPKNYRTS